MADVEIVIPWRSGCLHRESARRYVVSWYHERYPAWPVVVAEDGASAGEVWVKANAVTPAVLRSTARHVIIADADVICVGIGRAVEAVQSGAARWAVPHRRVYRLTPEATERVLAGEPMPDIPERTPRRRRPGERPRPWRAPDFSEIHTGMVGGGLVVLPRALYEEAPLDPRFAGWGGEDAAAGIMWRVLAGGPFRGSAPLFHLHHPPQPRLTRAIGSHESRALLMRYRAATTPEAMRALIAEHARTPTR